MLFTLFTLLKPIFAFTEIVWEPGSLPMLRSASSTTHGMDVVTVMHAPTLTSTTLAATTLGRVESVPMERSANSTTGAKPM